MLIEFWTHASRHEELRAEVSERHERNLDGIAALLERLADEHGVGFRIPSLEVARGHAAQRNGMELERLLDPGAAHPDVMEELTTGFVLGLTVPAAGGADHQRASARAESRSA